MCVASTFRAVFHGKGVPLGLFTLAEVTQAADGSRDVGFLSLSVVSARMLLPSTWSVNKKSFLLCLCKFSLCSW